MPITVRYAPPAAVIARSAYDIGAGAAAQERDERGRELAFRAEQAAAERAARAAESETQREFQAQRDVAGWEQAEGMVGIQGDQRLRELAAREEADERGKRRQLVLEGERYTQQQRLLLEKIDSDIQRVMDDPRWTPTERARLLGELDAKRAGVRPPAREPQPTVKDMLAQRVQETPEGTYIAQPDGRIDFQKKDRQEDVQKQKALEFDLKSEEARAKLEIDLMNQQVTTENADGSTTTNPRYTPAEIEAVLKNRDARMDARRRQFLGEGADIEMPKGGGGDAAPPPQRSTGARAAHGAVEGARLGAGPGSEKAWEAEPGRLGPIAPDVVDFYLDQYNNDPQAAKAAALRDGWSF